MHCWPCNLYQFLLLTIGECYTAHGKIYYQHRDAVFLYERCNFFVNQKVLKQTIVRLQRDNATYKNPSWDINQRSFFFSSDCFLKHKQLPVSFLFNIIQNTLSLPTFSYFMFFLSRWHNLRNTSWICSLTYLNFHFWLIECSIKTNLNNHPLLSERIVCGLFPIYFYFLSKLKHGR